MRFAAMVSAEGSTPTPERVYKMVDTCAGEFESRTPYYYASDDVEDDRVESPAAGSRPGRTASPISPSPR